MIISAEEHWTEATRTAHEFAFPRAVAILTGLNHAPTFVASGFFLRYGDAFFLLTASHATHNLSDGAYVGKDGFQPLDGTAIRSTSQETDNFDVAYWRVTQDLVDSVGATVVDESQVLRAQYQKPFYCVCGFPVSKNKPGKAVRVAEKQIKSYCFTFATMAANVDYSDFNKSEQAHVALHYGAGRNKRGEKVTPPNPSGMSGGALWVAKDMYSPERLSLGGLLIEYYAKKGKVAFCTRIQPILEFLRNTA